MIYLHSYFQMADIDGDLYYRIYTIYGLQSGYEAFNWWINVRPATRAFFRMSIGVTPWLKLWFTSGDGGANLGSGILKLFIIMSSIKLQIYIWFNYLFTCIRIELNYNHIHCQIVYLFYLIIYTYIYIYIIDHNIS